MAETKEHKAEYQAETSDNFGDCHRAKTRATGGAFLLYQAETEEYEAKY